MERNCLLGVQGVPVCDPAGLLVMGDPLERWVKELVKVLDTFENIWLACASIKFRN